MADFRDNCSQFSGEGEVWRNVPEFDVFAQNSTVPGFSPLFPQAHCTSDGLICQLVTGESEINAASTISALTLSSSFNLTKTYFLIAGISGANPKVTTITSVTFARFAIQVAMQSEIDGREIPADWPTGYVPQGSSVPGQYPQSIYGTEVFELNDALRQIAIGFTANVTLNDTTVAQVARAQYANDSSFAPGAAPPSIMACDTLTSDSLWSGDLLCEAFENTTALFSNGTALYCTKQQEDNATLESFLRGAVFGLIDFSRIILMRTTASFDRPPRGKTAYDNFLAPEAAFEPSLVNLYLAGVKVVQGIIDGWEETFEQGVEPQNYIGDIFGSLGGQPDFGPGSMFNGAVAPMRRLARRRTRSDDQVEEGLMSEV